MHVYSETTYFNMVIIKSLRTTTSYFFREEIVLKKIVIKLIPFLFTNEEIRKGHMCNNFNLHSDFSFFQHDKHCACMQCSKILTIVPSHRSSLPFCTDTMKTSDFKVNMCRHGRKTWKTRAMQAMVLDLPDEVLLFATRNTQHEQHNVPKQKLRTRNVPSVIFSLKALSDH